MERLVVETAMRTWRGQWQPEVDIPALFSSFPNDTQVDFFLIQVENPVHNGSDVPIVYIPYRQITAIYKEIQ